MMGQVKGLKPGMMSPPYRARCVSLILGLVACSAPARAEDLKAGLTALLETGWDSSTRSYQAAEKQAASLALAYPAEVRVPYAMAVIAIKHRRYSAALAQVDQMLVLKPHLWIGQRARLWLLVVLRQNETALEHTTLLAEQLAADRRLNAAQREQRAHWLGRIFAYIDAPTGETLAPEMLRRYEQRVLTAFDPATIKAFDEGRDSLLTAFTDRQFSHQQIKADEIVVAERQKAERATALELEKSQTTDAAGDIESQATALRDHLDDALRELDESIMARQTQLAGAQNQASVVLATLDQLAVNIDAIRLRLEATPPEDVAEQGRLLAILRAWEIDHARQAAVYRPLALQVGALQNELATLGAQRQQTVARFDAEMTKLGRTLTNLQRRLLRIEADERKLSKVIPSGNTPRARANSLALAALTTYEPFPVEQEKQTILRSLK